jgi:Cof subfamily protein (haloacid dehalogenase superfamily)
MPSIKLIAVDIDGTLLNSQFQVSAANLKALYDVQKAGIHVALATGRRHAFALPIARMLGFDPLIISSNGAVTRDTLGTLLAKTLMPRDTARAVLDHMQPWNDACVLTFDREQEGAMVVQSRTKLHDHIASWVDSNASFIREINPIQDSLTEDPIQTMYCGTLSDMAQAMKHLFSGAVSERVSCHLTRYDNRNLSIFDILPRGCTKGHALEQLCTALDIQREEVLAIGDNYNDTEMLNFAGHAFIVANAHQDMKDRGWKLTRSNDEDGVAHAIASVLETVRA